MSNAVLGQAMIKAHENWHVTCGIANVFSVPMMASRISYVFIIATNTSDVIPKWFAWQVFLHRYFPLEILFKNNIHVFYVCGKFEDTNMCAMFLKAYINRDENSELSMGSECCFK